MPAAPPSRPAKDAVAVCGLRRELVAGLLERSEIGSWGWFSGWLRIRRDGQDGCQSLPARSRMGGIAPVSLSRAAARGLVTAVFALLVCLVAAQPAQADQTR